MTLGNVAALVQDNVKRLLAYSSSPTPDICWSRLRHNRNWARPRQCSTTAAYAAMNVGAFARRQPLCKRGRKVRHARGLRGLRQAIPNVGRGLSHFS